ncbi:MAG: hypothetical protein R3247_05995 [Rhodothermales bacterium]|nr:hypothetical protein [Rhodothermales bacterium]
MNENVSMRCARFLAPLLVVFGLLIPLDAAAQAGDTRFGFGFNGLISTREGAGLGLGLRGRVSAPLNNDLSFAADLGLTGFVLRGRDDASYVFDPQVSAIVTLPPSRSRAPYVLGGIGAYVSFDDEETSGGPTIHGGIGWVQSLSETTLFYEVDPALIIGETSIDLALPFRVGIIF